MLEQERHWRFGWTAALGILVLLAGAEALWRGPVRFAANVDFNDFISPYIQSRAWMQGMDPYSPANLVRFWPRDAEQPSFLNKDAADGSVVLKRGIPTAYPLTALLLIAPVAVLPWRMAHALWLVISLLAYATTILSIRSLANLPWGATRTYAFLAFALALAPFHTGMGAGSIVIVAVAASTTAMWAMEREHSAFAGVCLVLAVGLKPQIGLPFLFYCVLQRRWRIAAIAAGGIAILFAVTVFRLALSGTPWIQNYLLDNRILLGYGSLGDFTERNPLRFGLINLQVLTYTILGHRDWANFSAFAVATTMGLTWLFLLSKRRRAPCDLLNMSALAVLSLLPVYHRLYDASLLILPLAWSVTALASPSKRFAKWTLFLLAVFLVPGGSALEQFQQSPYLAPLRHWWWWNTIVMPHQVWTLLVLGLVLLQAMRVEPIEALN